SMAGGPANRRMHFRIGSIAIPYVIDLLLQLQDKGRLSLDDPVSKWLPNLPNADRVTLRMLANSTSGYADWIQENPDFVKALFADVFRQWQTSEAAGDRAGASAHLPAGDVLSLRAHQLHHSRHGDPSRHRQTGGEAAAHSNPTPARFAQHADLRTATHPSAGLARVHLRARSIRGFDVLEPVVDDRREHDHDVDDRRRDEVGQGVRYGSVDLQGRRARAYCTDVGRVSGVQPEPLLRAWYRDLEHLGASEPRAERLHR